MHRLKALLLAAILTASCDGTEQIAKTIAPLYVDSHAGGHGPFLCAYAGGGTIPDWGCADISLTGYPSQCQRWCGDIGASSSHVGYVITPNFYWDTVTFSPNYTAGLACYGYPTGPTYAPCAGQTPSPVYGDSAHNLGPSSFMFGPESLILWKGPACPLTPGMTQIHMCTGDWTPYDGSGTPTAVISDGHATLELPRGNPLKLQPVHGTDVSCIATLSNYPLSPPPGTPPVVMAVYACP